MDGGSLALLGVVAFITIIVGVVERDKRMAAREKGEKYAKSLSSEAITFQYCDSDSAPGVTRQTAQRLAEQMGIDENQVIHQALYELATRNAVLSRQG